jgi:hypothetical protein
MKFKTKTLLGVGLVLIFILTTIFLTSTLLRKMKPQDENQKNIQIVLEQIFTCPDQEMIDAFSNMYIIKDEEINFDNPSSIVIGQFDTTEIEQKLKEKYAPYISDTWYDSFIQHFYNEFRIYSTAIDYETKVKHITITQSEKIPTNYSFTIDFNYVPSQGEKKDIKIEGSAQISEKDGKISYLQLFADRDFVMEFWKASGKINN